MSLYLSEEMAGNLNILRFWRRRFQIKYESVQSVQKKVSKWSGNVGLKCGENFDQYYGEKIVKSQQ